MGNPDLISDSSMFAIVTKSWDTGIKTVLPHLLFKNVQESKSSLPKSLNFYKWRLNRNHPVGPWNDNTSPLVLIPRWTTMSLLSRDRLPTLWPSFTCVYCYNNLQLVKWLKNNLLLLIVLQAWKFKIRVPADPGAHECLHSSFSISSYTRKREE